jgi:hypothetical protein
MSRKRPPSTPQIGASTCPYRSTGRLKAWLPWLEADRERS